MRRAVIYACIAFIGFSAAKVDDHVRPTMWGWVWQLEPKPDFPQNIPGVQPMDQLVRCPNGDLIFGPWHVYVLWTADGLKYFWREFLQERGH